MRPVSYFSAFFLFFKYLPLKGATNGGANSITAADQARYERETHATLARLAQSGVKVVPLASDQSKVYLEGTRGRRWNPIGEQPLIPDGARSKRAENLYGAVHLGTGAARRALRH